MTSSFYDLKVDSTVWLQGWLLQITRHWFSYQGCRSISQSSHNTIYGLWNYNVFYSFVRCNFLRLSNDIKTVCSKYVFEIFLFFSFRLIGMTKQWTLHKWKSTLYTHSRLPFSSGFVVRQRQEVIWTVVGSLQINSQQDGWRISLLIWRWLSRWTCRS